jgi:hypothetical protein
MMELSPERSPSDALLREVMECLIEHNRRRAKHEKAGEKD